ncbi:MAG: ABC transporter ATP-binding protein [Planctomycetota bacterium]
MLKLDHLTKRYDNGVLAVNDLNLEIQDGEIFALLGANGAGKTSTMMLVLGFTTPTSGTAFINGIDIRKDPLTAKKHVAYVSENVRLYGNFTALQNARFFTHLTAGVKVADDRIREALSMVGLQEEAWRRRVKGYSKGMRQRLGIAIAILKDAEVILLDEPTSGLDPKGGKDFLAILAHLKGRQKAIFMSTHDIFRAKDIADRIGIMNRGVIRIILERKDFDQYDLEELYIRHVDAVDGATPAAGQEL